MTEITSIPTRQPAAGPSPRPGLEGSCGRVLLTLALLALATTGLDAQPPKAPAKPPAKPGAGPAPKPVPFKTDILPSRMVDTEKLPAYLQKLEDRLAVLKRPHDPFGQMQDPSAPPPVVSKDPGTAKHRMTFEDLIKQVPVAAILAHENRFLTSGGRSVAKGDRIPLKTSVNGRQSLVQVEVTDVMTNKITFRNVVTNEVAVREIALMPAGMQSGTGSIGAPGLLPDNKDVPLDVEAPTGP